MRQALLNRDQDDLQLGVAFKSTKQRAVFGWYPYVEGFSADYAEQALSRFNPESVYDPFGGCGTVQVAASQRGIPSYYSEINPAMAFIANAKVNSTAWAAANTAEFSSNARDFVRSINSERFILDALEVDVNALEGVFPGRNYFDHVDAQQLILARQLIEDAAINPASRDLLMLSILAILVSASNMTRRADLRRRRSDEYKNRIVHVPRMVSESLTRIVDDILDLSNVGAATHLVGEDARCAASNYAGQVDLILTSPPYLNGTNYFRNAKLELWFLRLLASESDLRPFRDVAVCAGINDVSLKRVVTSVSETAEGVARKLDHESKDARIPAMIRGYFADMKDVLASCYRLLRSEGNMLLDIGDSKFYGVHVPTDIVLAELAEQVGFSVVERNLIARRVSRDKSELGQFELRFTK